jgi:hypothetical protein
LEQALVPSLCLERYPKSTIDIFITVLEDDGAGENLTIFSDMQCLLEPFLVPLSLWLLVDLRCGTLWELAVWFEIFLVVLMG